MRNIPKIRLGIIAVSRDCFPIELSRKRHKAVVEACIKGGLEIEEINTIIETEKDIPNALTEIEKAGIDALVLYLGNFGPEGPTTILAKKFQGPVMYAAAAEESSNDLINGRGDAYCGMLSASYNTGLRNVKSYIPEYPVGLPDEIVQMIREFIPIARILKGLKHLKIFTFGPRPQDFFACNSPIKPLFNLGVEIMENSELDLYDIYLEAKGDPGIPAKVKDIAKDLGKGNTYPDLLQKLAQYEIALLRFFEKNLGVSEYGIFANKCWPAFEKYFTFVPCYVNSRLASQGIPVSCEVDIYGTLSEYMSACASDHPPTLLDINNTVPPDMIHKSAGKIGNYKPTDLFMGFHCGNTPSSCMADHSLKYQLIMHRLMEPEKKPDITRGTLEGQIKSGDVTIFRLQSTAETELKAYVAQGEVLDINPRSFGGIGVFAIREMGRFYRHVLIEKRFPHHTAVAFSHCGKSLFRASQIMGVGDISFNLPEGLYYSSENPFK